MKFGVKGGYKSEEEDKTSDHCVYLSKKKIIKTSETVLSVVRRSKEDIKW